MEKRVLAAFYGVDEELADGDLLREIGEINALAKKAVEEQTMGSHLRVIEELEATVEMQARAVRILARRLAELGDVETGRDEIAAAEEAYRKTVGLDEWPE